MRNCITLRGQWMFPREANEHLLRMVRTGVLDLTGEAVTTFPLERCNDAVAHATAHPGPFKRTVMLPGGEIRD
jgi:alcohol dehydrogenase